jgi:hypothetical protein
MGMLTAVLTLLCLLPASADPIIESVVFVDRSHVGQELRDLLSIMQEEASMSCEPDHPEVPAAVEMSSSGVDRLAVLELERWEPWQKVGDRTVKVVSYDKGSTPRPGVATCEAGESR